MRNSPGGVSGKVDPGVFLTTSTFTPTAKRELDGREVRVVPINGEELVDLVIDHGVGVEPVKVATVNRTNEDFFEELLPEAELASEVHAPRGARRTETSRTHRIGQVFGRSPAVTLQFDGFV